MAVLSTAAARARRLFRSTNSPGRRDHAAARRTDCTIVRRHGQFGLFPACRDAPVFVCAKRVRAPAPALATLTCRLYRAGARQDAAVSNERVEPIGENQE